MTVQIERDGQVDTPDSTGVVDVSVAASESVEQAEEQQPSKAKKEGSGPPVVDRGLVAELVGQARGAVVSIDGEGGLLTKLVVESALEGELADHLGYDKHQRGGSVDAGGEPNARNGTRSKFDESTRPLAIRSHPCYDALRRTPVS